MVKFKFYFGSADYSCVQNVGLRVTIKQWVHQWGVSYIFPERNMKMESQCLQKLKRRFWRYIGAA